MPSPRLHFLRITRVWCAALFLWIIPPICFAEPADNTIRVGVLAYPGWRASVEHQKELLLTQARASTSTPKVLLAPGTAGDLISWAERGEIDAAIAPVGLFAQILARQSELSNVHWKHTADVVAGSERSATDARPSTSVCVVERASPIRSVGDLTQLSKDDGLRFIFPDPLSGSGRIAPQSALESAGVAIKPDHVSYARTHEAALSMLGQKDKSGLPAVACVSADVLATRPNASNLRDLSVPGLEAVHVPGEIVITREQPRSAAAAAMFSVATSAFSPAKDSSTTELAARWRPVLTQAGLHRSAQEITLDEVGETLVDYRRTHDTPIRLAIVFSGGGAKCSYQVGVIRALEEKLAEMRSQLSDDSFDIGLVVGTSGGALNALPTALGISKTREGWNDIAEVWKNLDQRELIRPSLSVRLDMVLWFACIQGIILLRIRKHRHFTDPDKYPWIISEFFIPFGIVEILLARIPYKPWSLLGTSGAIHHLWLWLTWGLEGSGWTLVVLGAGSLLLRHSRFVKHSPFVLRYRVMRRVFWIGLIGLPLIQCWTILFHQKNLSDAEGIQHALISSFRGLVDQELIRGGEPPLQTPKGDYSREVLESMSREVVSRNVLKRDLVLTASALPESVMALGGDLYFYAPAKTDSPEPKFEARGVSLVRRPNLLFDAVIASGAIYPVFPSRVLKNFPEPGDELELVDGSFDHRSPIEAAALWGATHIIQIQAVTDEISQRGSFAANINAALNHLYDQAQLLDTRSKEQVVTFTVTPQVPHIGLLDFSDNLIEHSIEKGYREGGGVARENTANYRKELGRPQFLELK